MAAGWYQPRATAPALVTSCWMTSSVTVQKQTWNSVTVASGELTTVITAKMWPASVSHRHLAVSHHNENHTLQWRHNERHGVSNHRGLHSLLNCWFRRRSKKTLKLRVTGLCAGNSPVTGEFPAQKASNAENVSIDDIMTFSETGCYPISVSFTVSNSLLPEN